MSIRFHYSSLADGREIIYVDDHDTAPREAWKLDERVLDPRPSTPEMRLDPLTGEWVSIVPGRQSRVVLPDARANPLVPQSAMNPSEIPNNYDVVVFENRSPSFGPAVEQAEFSCDVGFGVTQGATGRCEVVCFSPDPTGSLGSQSVSRVRTVIEAWAERTVALSALPGVEQVFIFENRGEAIGVTLHHPHGQIYAYPFVTPRTSRLLDAVTRYGSTFFADLLAFEQAGPRVIHRGDNFTAFVPFAARWPLEIHLLPNRHVADLAELSAQERDELAITYRGLLQTLDAVYHTPTPYISAWHQAPIRSHRDSVRLMLQLTSPRRGEKTLKFLAGSEAAMGAFIGDVSPETQADMLRTAWASL